MGLKLKLDRSRLDLSNGFGVKVEGKDLLLPAEIWKWTRRMNLALIEDFLSGMHIYPETLAEHLGWSVAQVEAARTTLMESLHGLVEEQYLNPPSVAGSGPFIGGVRPSPGDIVVAKRR